MEIAEGCVRGTIIEVRPKALYRIRLDDGRVVTGNISTSLRHAVVRILIKNQVLVRLSPHDPHRGQIIQLAE